MEQKEHRLAVIMYVDVCDFSKFIERDEEQALQFLDDLTSRLESTAPEFSGNVIKTTGDTFLLDFKTTLDAVKCGIKIQKEIAPGFNFQERPVQLRIGIHLGDIYFLKNDALGEGINIATRLQSICQPGRLCMSGEVYHQVSGKITLPVESLGMVKLKNISREIEGFEIVTAEGTVKSRNAAQTPENEVDSEQEEQIDFRELKDLIVDQIRHAGSRIREEHQRQHWKPPPPPPPKGRGFHFETEKEEEEPEIDDADLDDPYRPYREYKHRVIRQAAMKKVGFAGHLVPYVAVNGFLIFLNLRFSPGFFWAAFPLCGWGIGILGHIAQIGVKNKEKNDVQRLPDLKPREYRLLRKIHAMKERIVSHAASTIGVTILLSVINRIASPGFFWAIIPIAAMTIGLVAHLVRHSTESSVLKKEFKDRVFGDSRADFVFGKSGGSGTPSMKMAEEPATSDIVNQALTLREGILNQLKSLEKDKVPVGEDMHPILDNYVDQIRELNEKNQDLDHLLNTMPIGNLEHDRTALQGKLESSNSEYLRKEYEKSIAEIDKQVSSYDELKNQKEVIRLRLSSAVNSLKQMQLDLARMKTISTSNERASIQMLKDKSKELSDYLEDLKQSYQELDDGST